MNTSNYRGAAEGHRIGSASNRDLTQKLTYQQLLNLNHDLSKENLQLKNIGNRLGNQLRALHNQFQIKPREENVQLYTAINVHPILHQYELTLIPLLDAYEAKIQEFQNGFETINQQFINLEKKYQEVVTDNQKLRNSLTEKTIELIDAYKNTSLQKVGSDFQQIILQQINQKQKFLATQNSRLQREYQRYKSQAEKSTRQLGDYKRRYEESSKSVNVLSASQSHLEKQVKFLKENNFKSQMQLRELEGEKKKITDELQRAQSQISLLNRDRDGLIRSFQSLKNDFEKMGSSQGYQQKTSFESKQKSSIHEPAQQQNDDTFKKLAKLQKQYDSTLKQRNKLKEQLQQSRVTLEQTNERLVQMKKKLDAGSIQKNTIQMSQLKAKKMLVQLGQKAKNDLEQLKREHQDQMRRVEEQNYSKLQAKIKKIGQIQQLLERVKLERDKLQQQNIIHTTLNQQNKQANRNKDGERAVEKLKQKLAINEQLFKEQIHIIENDNIYLKKENDKNKAEAKERNDQIRRLKQQLQRVKKQLADVNEQKTIMIEEIKRIKNDYEGNLRDKERLFDQKIRQIKLVVQQSDKRRKADKQKAVQAARQYKRVLQQIKNAYEERIRALEGQTAGYGGKSKKIESY